MYDFPSLEDENDMFRVLMNKRCLVSKTKTSPTSTLLIPLLLKNTMLLANVLEVLLGSRFLLFSLY
jgi:hypothetical protein